MAALKAVALCMLLVGALSLFATVSAHEGGDVQCSDDTAKSVISTLGGRSRIMTLLMNFVKCLQRASADIYKSMNDILTELTGCLAKHDVFDVVKCMSMDPGLKKISSLVVRTMDVFKCALE